MSMRNSTVLSGSLTSDGRPDTPPVSDGPVLRSCYRDAEFLRGEADMRVSEDMRCAITEAGQS